MNRRNTQKTIFLANFILLINSSLCADFFSDLGKRFQQAGETIKTGVQQTGKALELPPVTTKVTLQNAGNVPIKPFLNIGNGWQDYGTIEPYKEWTWTLTIKPGTHYLKALVSGKETAALPFTDLVGNGSSTFHVNIDGLLMPSGTTIEDRIKTYVTLTNDSDYTVEPLFSFNGGKSWPSYGAIQPNNEWRWEHTVLPGSYQIKANLKDKNGTIVGTTAALTFTDRTGLLESYFYVDTLGTLLSGKLNYITTTIALQNNSLHTVYPAFDLKAKGLTFIPTTDSSIEPFQEKKYTLKITPGTHYVGILKDGKPVATAPFTTFDDNKTFDFYVDKGNMIQPGKVMITSRVTIQNDSDKPVAPLFDTGKGLQAPPKGPKTLNPQESFTYALETNPGVHYVGGVVGGVKTLVNLPFAETSLSKGSDFDFFVTKADTFLAGKAWINTNVVISNGSCLPVTPFFKAGIGGTPQKYAVLAPQTTKQYSVQVPPGTNYLYGELPQQGSSNKTAQLAFTDFDGKATAYFHISADGVLLPEKVTPITTTITVQNDYSNPITPELSFCGNKDAGYALSPFDTIGPKQEKVFTVQCFPGTHWIRARLHNGALTDATIFTDIAGKGQSFFHVTKEGKLAPGKARIITTVTVQNGFTAPIKPYISFENGRADSWNTDSRYQYDPIEPGKQTTWTFDINPGTHYIKADVAGKGTTATLVFTDLAGGGSSSFFVDSNGTLLPQKGRVSSQINIQNLRETPITPYFSFKGTQKDEFKPYQSMSNKKTIAPNSQDTWEFNDTPGTYFVKTQLGDTSRYTATLPFTLTDNGASAFHVTQDGVLLPEKALLETDITLFNHSNRPCTLLVKKSNENSFKSATESIAPNSSKTVTLLAGRASTHLIQVDFDGKKTTALPLTLTADKQKFNYFVNKNYDLLSGVLCACSIKDFGINFETIGAECDQCQNACDAVVGSVISAITTATLASAAHLAGTVAANLATSQAIMAEGMLADIAKTAVMVAPRADMSIVGLLSGKTVQEGMEIVAALEVATQAHQAALATAAATQMGATVGTTVGATAGTALGATTGAFVVGSCKNDGN